MVKRLRRITLLLLLAASLNLGWQFYQMDQEAKERQRIFEESGFIICSFGPSVDQWSRLCIELCVIAAFVGSWMKGFKSVLLTVGGLTGATLIFILWRRMYFRLVEISGGKMDWVEHIGGLENANYLDIAIAGTVMVLILLNLYNSVLRFRTTSDLD